MGDILASLPSLPTSPQGGGYLTGGGKEGTGRAQCGSRLSLEASLPAGGPILCPGCGEPAGGLLFGEMSVHLQTHLSHMLQPSFHRY